MTLNDFHLLDPVSMAGNASILSTLYPTCCKPGILAPSRMVTHANYLWMKCIYNWSSSLGSSTFSFQNTDRVFSLYQTFPESKTSDIDVPRNPYVREGSLHPPSPAHLSVCQRLRKVIQELVDTEKSYVKVGIYRF